VGAGALARGSGGGRGGQFQARDPMMGKTSKCVLYTNTYTNTNTATATNILILLI
jgi:hypothetical protein